VLRCHARRPKGRTDFRLAAAFQDRIDCNSCWTIFDSWTDTLLQHIQDIQDRFTPASFTSLWTRRSVQAYWGFPLPSPLPTSGPLYELLLQTSRLLRPALRNTSTFSGAVARLSSDLQALPLLAKLVTWLQQRPCRELYSLVPNRGASPDSLQGLGYMAVLLLAETLSNDISCWGEPHVSTLIIKVSQIE
jgi:hypothetical protein